MSEGRSSHRTVCARQGKMQTCATGELTLLLRRIVMDERRLLNADKLLSFMWALEKPCSARAVSYGLRGLSLVLIAYAVRSSSVEILTENSVITT